MERFNKKIIIPQKVLEVNDPYITTSYIASYLLLPYNNLTNLITTENIGYMLYGEKCTHKHLLSINNAMTVLCEICGFEKLCAHKYLLNWDENFQLPKGSYFIVLNDEHFYKILNSGNRNRFMIIHHLCCLIDSCSYNLTFRSEDGAEKRKVVGTMPQSYFANKYGVSGVSIAGYNDFLKKQEIMYFIKAQYNPLDDFPMSNVYSLLENKKYADRYFKECGLKKAGKTSSSSNYMRSVAQRYNRFIEHPEERTVEKAEDLLRIVNEFNEQYPGKAKPTILIELYLKGVPQERINEMVGELTDMQKQKIELGLATYQDFLYETLASDHNM